MASLRVRTPRDDHGWDERQNDLIVLIVEHPFHAHHALRLCTGWREFDHLALDPEDVPGVHGSQPTQFVDSET
jgi:hypothetical protein